jgi:hypothetical protein
MFDHDQRDLTATLSNMHRQAIDRCQSNQIEAKQKMAQWLGNDRRFDSYDASRLVDRVALCRSNGAQLDLSDPQLLRGGKPRPLSR